jgi:endonuclease/exonuclease/phosphatase (EEP) superfamily protein YafD
MPRTQAGFAACAAAALASCAMAPPPARLVRPGPHGALVDAGVAACPPPSRPEGDGSAPLRGGVLRVASWNLHKAGDDGWEQDLRALAQASDLLLLQEAVLTPEVRRVVEGAGHSWRMAWAFSDVPLGVMIAARSVPMTACVQLAREPLFYLPKSAMVARYRMTGDGRTLTVANLHAINFTPGLVHFEEQLQAVARELDRSEGPVILAGDFNTWSKARHEAMLETAKGLKLKLVKLRPDLRSRAFGWHLDHFFVRGLRVVRARAHKVDSSDHNPIVVELESAGP